MYKHNEKLLTRKFNRTGSIQRPQQQGTLNAGYVRVPKHAWQRADCGLYELGDMRNATRFNRPNNDCNSGNMGERRRACKPFRPAPPRTTVRPQCISIVRRHQLLNVPTVKQTTTHRLPHESVVDIGTLAARMTCRRPRDAVHLFAGVVSLRLTV